MARAHPSTPSKTMQIAILFYRYAIVCLECGERIEKPSDAEWDHRTEFADGGEHTIENIGPVHDKASGGCHQRKSAKSESVRSRIDRLEKKANAHVPGFGFVPVKVERRTNDEDLRCSKCGEYRGSCTCLVRQKRKASIQSPGFRKAPEGHIHFPRRMRTET